MSVNAYKRLLTLFIAVLENLPSHLSRFMTIPKFELVENHYMALSLLHNDGDSDRLDEAILLYRHNAHLGFAGSQTNFGDLFEDGDIVPKDLLVAMYWYARSSERGEPTAYYSIASILRNSIENSDALAIAAQYAILTSNQLLEGKNESVAIQLRDTL